MNIVDELADCRRRALGDVLDTLGADGVAVWHSGTAPDALMREIFGHVRWLEQRERWSALEDAAKKADAHCIVGRDRARRRPDVYLRDCEAADIADEIRAMQQKEEA